MAKREAQVDTCNVERAGETFDGSGGDGKKISKLDNKIKKPPSPPFACQPLKFKPPSQTLALRDRLYTKAYSKKTVNLSLSSITYKQIKKKGELGLMLSLKRRCKL